MNTHRHTHTHTSISIYKVETIDILCNMQCAMCKRSKKQMPPKVNCKLKLMALMSNVCNQKKKNTQKELAFIKIKEIEEKKSIGCFIRIRLSVMSPVLFVCKLQREKVRICSTAFQLYLLYTFNCWMNWMHSHRHYVIVRKQRKRQER